MKADKGLSLICDFNSLIGRKTLLDPSTLFKSTVLDTRRQCQEIIKQNDLPQCDRGSPLTFSLPCPLNNIKHCHTGYIGRVLSCIEADFI